MADPRSKRPEDQGYRNPPLHVLNVAYRAEDEENRDTVADAASAASGVVRDVLLGRTNGRRVRKNIRPLGS